MSIEIKAPLFPESVAEGTIAAWHKKAGESVARDALLLEVETDKVVLEVLAPQDGVLTEILKQEGDTVQSQEKVGLFTAGAKVADHTDHASDTAGDTDSKATAESSVASEQRRTGVEDTQKQNSDPAPSFGPAVRNMLDAHQINPESVQGSGKSGRILKEDVRAHLDGNKQNAADQSAIPANALATAQREERVPMSRLRMSVAKRLLSAQQNAAMLTTFNEVNMQPVMDLRARYKESFEKKHQVRLGFMSFFVKAAVEALKRFPDVNAFIDGNDIIYHAYQNVGVAVSSPRGLVVPVLNDVDAMNFADIEQNIANFGTKAKEGKLTIEEMQGGTFTISNGGVFGSLMSTPILNPPQTAILGMHKIQERPMAVKGQVVILPMMYLALSYDHRMIDGKAAVQFLVTIKDLLEDPARLLLGV